MGLKPSIGMNIQSNNVSKSVVYSHFNHTKIILVWMETGFYLCLSLRKLLNPLEFFLIPLETALVPIMVLFKSSSTLET